MWKLMNDTTARCCVLHARATNQCKKYYFVMSLTSNFKFNPSVSPADTV